MNPDEIRLEEEEEEMIAESQPFPITPVSVMEFHLNLDTKSVINSLIGTTQRHSIVYLGGHSLVISYKDRPTDSYQ